MTISISIQRALQQIYALSAMRSYINHNVKEIPLLQPDHSEALSALVVDAFCDVAVEIAPYLTSTTVPEDGSDIMEMIFRDDIGEGFAHPISINIENTIVEKVLYAIFADIDKQFAGENLRRSARSAQLLSSIINCSPHNINPMRVKPYY